MFFPLLYKPIGIIDGRGNYHCNSLTHRAWLYNTYFQEHIFENERDTLKLGGLHFEATEWRCTLTQKDIDVRKTTGCWSRDAETTLDICMTHDKIVLWFFSFSNHSACNKQGEKLITTRYFIWFEITHSDSIWWTYINVLLTWPSIPYLFTIRADSWCYLSFFPVQLCM